MSTRVEERASRHAVRSKHTRRSFGLSGVEIGLIILALIAFISAIFYYYTALSSVQSKLRTQEQELHRITDELTRLSPNGNGGPAGPNVKETLASLQSFKSDYLKPLGPGRIALINEVNALAK